MKYKLLIIFIFLASLPAHPSGEYMLGAKGLNVLAPTSFWDASTDFRFDLNSKTAAQVEAAASTLPYKNPQPLTKHSYD